MCLSPITMRGPQGVVTFPCGKCLECVAKYQNDWRFRISVEAWNYKYCYFLTLTMSNKNIPYVSVPDHIDTCDLASVIDGISKLPPSDSLARCLCRHTPDTDYLRPDKITYGTLVPSVCKSDVQDWIKRSRMRLSRLTGLSDPDFKYFLCSEYGPHTLRPHYHVIIMCNVRLSIFTRSFVDSWSLGHVNWKHKPLSFNAEDGIAGVAKYVAKYCAKPASFENPYVLYGIVDKPFRLMSKGIGKCMRSRVSQAIKDIHARFKNRHYGEYYGYNKDYIESLYHGVYQIYENGFFYSMPRYWRDYVLPQHYVPSPIFVKDPDTGLYYRKMRFRHEKNSLHPLCVALSNFARDRYLDSLLPIPEDCEDIDKDIQRFHSYASALAASSRSRYAAKAKMFKDYYGKSLY